MKTRLCIAALAMLVVSYALGQETFVPADSVPKNFRASGENQIDLSWTEVKGAGGYIIRYDLTENFHNCCILQVIPGTKTSFTINAGTPIELTGPPSATKSGFTSGALVPVAGMSYTLQIKACPPEHFAISASYACSGNTDTITVTPSRSADKSLSSLTAGAGGSSSGPFSPITLTKTGDYTYAATFRDTAANPVTHVKLTPTATSSYASASPATSAVMEGVNTLTFTVTAQDGTSQMYTVTVTLSRLSNPSKLGKPSVSNPDYKTLTVSWTPSPSSEEVYGYDVHYAIYTGASFPPGTYVPTTGTTATISNLGPGTYQVRVRAKNRVGVGLDSPHAVVEIQAWSLSATGTTPSCGSPLSNEKVRVKLPDP